MAPPPLLSQPPLGAVDGEAEAEPVASPRDGSRDEDGGRQEGGPRDEGEGGGGGPEEEAAPSVTAAADTEPPLPAPAAVESPPASSVSGSPAVLQEELSPVTVGPPVVVAVTGALSANVSAAALASGSAVGTSGCADEQAPEPSALVSEEAARGADEQAPEPCSAMGLSGGAEAASAVMHSSAADVGAVGGTERAMGAAPELEAGAGAEFGAVTAGAAAAPEVCASVHAAVEPDLEVNSHNMAPSGEAAPSSSPSGSLGPGSLAGDPAAIMGAEHCAAAAALDTSVSAADAAAPAASPSPRSPGPAVPAEPVPLLGFTMDAGGEVDLFEGLARNDN